jgi:hypothetical protein
MAERDKVRRRLLLGAPSEGVSKVQRPEASGPTGRENLAQGF